MPKLTVSQWLTVKNFKSKLVEDLNPNEVLLHSKKGEIKVYSIDGSKVLLSSEEVGFDDFTPLSEYFFGDEKYKTVEIFHGNLSEYQAEKNGETNNFDLEIRPDGLFYYRRKNANERDPRPEGTLLKKIKIQL